MEDPACGSAGTTDGAGVASDGGRDAAGQRVSSSGWVPTEDVMGRPPDRQVLVVGDTLIGRWLAVLLRQAGYDPLVVAGRDPPIEPQVTYLWPSVLERLAAIGVGKAVLDRGVTVDAVSVRHIDAQRDERRVLQRDVDTGTVPPVVIQTHRLRDTLEKRLPHRQGESMRTVESLSRRDDGLVVEFDDGIQEWFDVVVDAGVGDPSLRAAGSDALADRSLTQYETVLKTGGSPPSRLRDSWYPTAFVQQVPLSNGRIALRATTLGSELPAGHIEPFEDSQSGDSIDYSRVLAAVDPTSVRQAALPAPDAPGAWWGDGRVAFCGSSAYPVAPASGFGGSFGIEDALAFVAALTRTTQSISDVVDSYATRRARRLTAVRRGVESARPGHEYPVAAPPDSPFRAVESLRTVTLAQFLGPPLTALQRDSVG
jgi:2-polyprenyl-6-methoxyphenol hydroxylase-like FAD-dependent oxidoreductase